MALTDGNGNVQTKYQYDPFGNTSYSGPANSNPYQYLGRELESPSGAYYLRNRYYDPTLQRFVSPTRPATPQAMRTYTATSSTAPTT